MVLNGVLPRLKFCSPRFVGFNLRFARPRSPTPSQTGLLAVVSNWRWSVKLSAYGQVSFMAEHSHGCYGLDRRVSLYSSVAYPSTAMV